MLSIEVRLQINSRFLYTAARNHNRTKSFHTWYTYRHLVENRLFLLHLFRNIGMEHNECYKLELEGVSVLASLTSPLEGTRTRESRLDSRVLGNASPNLQLYYQGSHHQGKTWKTWKMVKAFSRPEKIREFDSGYLVGTLYYKHPIFHQMLIGVWCMKRSCKNLVLGCCVFQAIPSELIGEKRNK